MWPAAGPGPVVHWALGPAAAQQQGSDFSPGSGLAGLAGCEVAYPSQILNPSGFNIFLPLKFQP